MDTAASLIRAARRRAGVTQAELARRAGTSQAAIARYEAGDVSPMVETLARLLEAAGVELELAIREPERSSVPDMAFVRAHRDRILSLAATYGASNVRVFGSVARGEASAGSDVDFLVDFDTSRGLMPLFRLTTELEGELSCPVDVSPQEILKPEVEKRALSEAVAL